MSNVSALKNLAAKMCGVEVAKVPGTTNAEVIQFIADNNKSAVAKTSGLKSATSKQDKWTVTDDHLTISGNFAFASGTVTITENVKRVDLNIQTQPRPIQDSISICAMSPLESDVAMRLVLCYIWKSSGYINFLKADGTDFQANETFKFGFPYVTK
jgi:hypothetical protein